MHAERIGCRSSSRALNQDAPTHAFEIKHHVHRDERLRGDVGVKPGTVFDLVSGEALPCASARGTVTLIAVCATQTATRFMSHSRHRDGA